ncbi:hypothetical protein AB0I28_26070 [Phytomonospora sp. NPDC050363]|uniref:hypothetical protein n=1 Tax=Phytomonospora sp. NPDC050363 TaxID=3155642 RepID=UPI0033EF4CF4
MPSSKGKARERELARAKAERQLARRAAAARRRRQWQAGLVIGLIIVAAVGVAMIFDWGPFADDKSNEQPDVTTSTSTDPSSTPSEDTSPNPSDEPSDDK